MAQLDDERLKIAAQVHQALGNENELTASQARLFVRCLQTTWNVPLIRWGEGESQQQLSDARRLLHVAGIFRHIQGRESVQALDCYRRAGELLEWLKRSADDVSADIPIELLAAGAYQLGGLPAMASGLLRQLKASHPGVSLLAAFLGGDFDSVVGRAMTFWSENRNLTSREATVEILSEEAEDRFDWHVTVELVRCLGLFADALRRGNDPRLLQAMEKLKALASLASRTGTEALSTLLNLLIATAEGYIENSVYAPADALGSANEAFSSRLRLFAREQFSRSRGTLWPSQQRGLQKLLESSSFALCTPTGSGKTLVANFALLKELLQPVTNGPAPLALYLVPSRALAGEVESKLTSELGRDLTITGLYGGADWGITDYWLNSDKPSVLIATVEKADALMRYVGPLLLTKLRLLIVDEAHQVVADASQRGMDSLADHSSRSIRLEGFVSRLLARRPDVVRIALTAVAGGAAQPVAEWIEGTTAAVPIGLRYRSTRQIVGALEVRPNAPGQIVLDQLNGQPLFVRGRQEPVYIGLRFQPMPQLPAGIRNSINHFNQLDVLWTSLHLVEGKRRILISVMQQPEQTMRWYVEALQLSGWEDLGKPMMENNSALQALFIEARATCVDYCGPDSHEVALLDRGIATSHGQMPQRLRRLMTSLIDRKVCAITVATATLTEGVNLPFDLIFVASLQRSSFDPSIQRRVLSDLPTAEFRNLAGRAGRPGSADGMEGMILVALPQRPSATARDQLTLQRRQIADLQQNYNNLLGRLLAEERVANEVASPLGLLLTTLKRLVEEVLGLRDSQAFLIWLETALPQSIAPEAGTGANIPTARLADTLDELDSFLLNAVEELQNLETNLNASDVEAILISVWSKTFTAVASRTESWLERAFIKRGSALVERIYPDTAERRRLYQYGFTPVVGRRFEATAVLLHAELVAATSYGVDESSVRLQLFERLGSRLLNERGFGFRVRDTVSDQALLSEWTKVLAWWMNCSTESGPLPDELRSWQRFVSDNLDFRLGVALGAVAAQSWSTGSGNPSSVPSLAVWKQTTGLPWIGFWAKELLRWGTLEPFVAFAMAQGLAATREAATMLRARYIEWLRSEVESPEDDDYIDPQRFLAWQRMQTSRRPRARIHAPTPVELSGTNGARLTYDVVPLLTPEGVEWIDAAGFSLAKSSSDVSLREQPHKSDFILSVGPEQIVVERAFSPR
ncbi:MAG: DEAD/DEAH box helicase [Gammaproteobacteria bacterium]|nr:DEAD/DEAH box helicase [Gammaproteobacteria bacterium]